MKIYERRRFGNIKQRAGESLELAAEVSKRGVAEGKDSLGSGAFSFRRRDWGRQSTAGN